MANPKMISVEVDEEVFDHIKSRSEPLVDTFNSTIRRILKLDQTIKPVPRIRTTRGVSKDRLVSTVLGIIRGNGGQINIAELYSRVEKSGVLQHEDFLVTNRNKPHFHSRVRNLKPDLISDGLLKPKSPKGTWELTPAGFSRALSRLPSNSIPNKLHQGQVDHVR